MSRRHSSSTPSAAPPGEAPRRSRGRRALRVALTALALLAAAELLYLAAGNLLLARPVRERWLERRPEKWLADWDRAWTVVPGRVHLEGFRLRAQHRPAQWLLGLDRATATVDLPALARRSFHLTSLDGEGLSFRLRRRLDTRPEAVAAAEAAPPIPGLANPPERPPEELYPRRGERPGWTIELDRVTVGGVREIWIDEHRLTGDGRLSGSFALQIRSSLEMEGARLRFADAELERAGAPVADRLNLDLGARFHRFDPSEHRGREKLRFLSGRLDLRGRTVDLGRLIEPPRRTGEGWIDLDGAGDLTARIDLDRGTIAAGSELAVDAPRLSVDYLGYHAEGSGRLTARVAAEGEGEDEDEDQPAAHVLARLDRFTVRAPARTEPHVEGSGFALSVRSAPPDLAGPPPPAEVRILLPRSEVPDLTVYDAYLPSGSGLDLVGGRGEVTGWMRYSTAERTGRAELTLTADGAAARYRGLPLTGDLRLDVRLPRFDPHARRFDLAGTRAEVTGVSAGDGVAGWWGRFELPEGALDLGTPGAADHLLEARFAGRARDSAPVLALFATRHPALRWFDELLKVEDLAVSGRLVAGGEALSIRDLRLGNRRLSIEGRLHLGDGAHRGVYLASYGPLTAAVAATGDEREWKLTGSREWYRRRVRSMPP